LFRVSARRRRSRKTADRGLCFQPDGSTAYTGHTVELYSLRITGVAVRRGRTFASAIDVYRRFTTTCGAIRGSAVTLYRGTRSDLP